MLTDERRRQILERLQLQGRVLAVDLATEFGVSGDTVRRDLRELDKAGALRRVHGGAMPRRGDGDPFPVRARRAPDAKLAIARRGAELVRDGQVIVLDGGSTTLELARGLPERLQATIVTNSPAIALELADRHPGIETLLVGGAMHPRAHVSTGASAVMALSAVRADLLFLGVCALHPEIGITIEELAEQETKRAMIAGAAEVVALADREKLGTQLPFVVAPLDVVTKLVTDVTGDEMLAPYVARGIELALA